jgi:hypothetical protein
MEIPIWLYNYAETVINQNNIDSSHDIKHFINVCEYIIKILQDYPDTIIEGLSREEKARQRTNSVWREIDKSCVVGEQRYLISIKSGPNTINDTQVQAMYKAIADNHVQWFNMGFPEFRST